MFSLSLPLFSFSHSQVPLEDHLHWLSARVHFSVSNSTLKPLMCSPMTSSKAHPRALTLSCRRHSQPSAGWTGSSLTPKTHSTPLIRLADPCQPLLLVPLPLVTLINIRALYLAFLSCPNTLFLHDPSKTSIALTTPRSALSHIIPRANIVGYCEDQLCPWHCLRILYIVSSDLYNNPRKVPLISLSHFTEHKQILKHPNSYSLKSGSEP